MITLSQPVCTVRFFLQPAYQAALAQVLLLMATLTDCRTEPADLIANGTGSSAGSQGLAPVSIEWRPPFTMMVDLIGHGDTQAGCLCMLCS